VGKKNKVPAGLNAESKAYDKWFKTKIREALEDNTPNVPHQNVMADMKRVVSRKHSD